MWRKTRTTLSITLVIAVLAGVVFLAVQADGREATRASSNDGGAWLAVRSRGGVAHVEFETNRPTAHVVIEKQTGSEISVRQAHGITAVHDRTSSSLAVIDQANASRQTQTSIPFDSIITPIPGGVAVHDLAGSQLWITSTAELSQLDSIDEVPPVRSGGLRALLVSARGDQVLVGVDGSVAWFDSELPPVQLPADFEPEHITMAGDQAVFVDGRRWVVATADGYREVPPFESPDVSVMQRPNNEYPQVAYVADDGSMWVVDLVAGTGLRVGQIDGPPTQTPIYHDGCLYVLYSTGTSAETDSLCLDGRQASVLNANRGKSNPIVLEAELRLVNGRVFIDELDGSGYTYDLDLELLEIGDFTDIFDERQEEENELSDNVVEEVDQQDQEATLAEDGVDDESEENRPPTARDDNVGTRLGRPVVVDVLANDFDPDFDVLLIEPGLELLEGTARLDLSSDRTSVQVTELAGEGTIRFRYTITDGAGPESVSSAVATVSVLPRVELNNLSPEPEVDRLVGEAGTVLTVNLTDNDLDPDGDSLVLISVDEETDVDIIAVHPNGDVLVALPNRVVEGVIEVGYIIEDEWGAVAEEGILQVSTRIASSNFPPIASGDTGSTQVGRRVVLNLLANDVDNDGDLLSATAARLVSSSLGPDVSTAEVGLVSTTTEGEFTFEPSAPGTYIFEYEATDRRSSDRAEVRIEVTEPTANRAPIALRDDAVIALGETRLIRAFDNDGDPDGDLFGVIDQTRNPNLDIVLEQGTGFFVTMRPGSDTVETFRYRVSDGLLESDLATVVVARSGSVFQDAPPVAVDDSMRVRDGRRSVLLVLRNDFDPEGGILTITEANVSDDDVAVDIGPLGQWVEVDVAVGKQGTFDVQYTVEDVAGNLEAGTATVGLVPPDESNSAPIARSDSGYTIEGQPVNVQVLANDTDPQSDPLSLTDQQPTSPTGGTITANDERTGFIYRPQPGFLGTDRFTYVVRDSEGAESVGFVQVAVMPTPEINTDPVANPDLGFSFVAGAGEVPLDVLTNDVDFDGDELTVIDVRGSDLVTNAGNGLTLELPASAASEMTISLTYEISDGRGGTDSTEVTVVVLPNVDPVPPVAEPDELGPIKEGDQEAVEVVANDTDPDGDESDLVVTIDETNPAITLDPDNPQIVIVTAPAESGQVEYTITDVDGLSASSFIDITVIPNLPPTVRSPIFIGEFNTDLEIPRIDLADYVTDPEDDELTFRGISAQVGGTTRLDQDSADARFVNFEPNDDFEGEAGFVFTVADAAGNEVTGRVTLLLLGRSNRPPEALSTSIEIEAGIPQPFDLTSLFTDPDDGDTVIVEVLTTPGDPIEVGAVNGGVVQLSAPITADTTSGVAQVRGTDREGEFADATLEITLLPSSVDPPVAIDDEAETNQEQTIDVNVLLNDVDTLGQGDLKIISTFVDATAGSSTFDTDTITYVPEATFFGEARIEYRIADARNRVDGEADGLLIIKVIGRPDAPAGLEVSSGGPTDVSLSWRVPANNGAEIDGYRIRATGDDGSSEELGVSASSPSHRFSDRTPGVEYRFEVLAFNKAGDGEYSGMSSPIKPDEVPGPPGKPEVAFSETPGELLISWTEPVPGDYSPIAKYHLEINGCTSEIRDVTLALDYVWSGLENGVRCSFRVYAENERVQDGFDPTWSTSSDSECPVERPETPDRPSVVRGDKEATVSWAQPTNPDCEDLIAYELVRFRDGEQERADIAEAGVLSDNVGGLVNGSVYCFEVRAQNRQDWSDYSSRSFAQGARNCVKPCGRPMAPPAMSATRGDQLATVVSNGPADANGCEITQYQIEVEGGGIEVQPGDDIIRNLVNGTSYRFRLRGINEIGDGDWSEWSNSITPAGPPIGGQIRAVSNGDMYDWVIDSADGNGTTITGYTLSGDLTGFNSSTSQGTAACRNDQSNQCEATNGDREEQTTCDQDAQTVTVSGRAVNDVGQGPLITQSLTLEGCPSQPSVNALTATVETTSSASYRVTWSRPGGSGTDIHVQRDNGSWDGPLSGSSKTYTSNVGFGDRITVRIWACNEFGCRSSGTDSVTVPTPSVSASWGSVASPQPAPCTNGQCRYMNFSWSNFPSGGSFGVDCYSNGGLFWVDSSVSGSSGSSTTICSIQPGFEAPAYVRVGGVKSTELF